METKRLTNQEVKEAAQILKNGSIVAFPTETVYGLGALATNEEAVKKVYLAKGRPSDNPLIVHVSSIEMLEQYTETLTTQAKIALKHFSPGPLTIILKAKKGILPSVVTAGLDTVALRIPNHPDTLHLIEQVGSGLVGPSANTSGKPSPTTADHVLHDLQGKIEAVLDGGSTQIGLESTVLDCSVEGVSTILRPGAITKEMLETVLPNVQMDQHLVKQDEAPRAPGMKYTHYAPDAQVYLLSKEQDFEAAIKWAKEQHYKIGIVADESITEQFKGEVSKVFSLTKFHNIQTASQNLFSALREMDEAKVEVIFAETFEKNGLAVAYMNRLEKAAGNKWFKN